MSLKQLEKYVQSKIQHESTGHDLLHALRVRNNAILITGTLNVDRNVIEASCLVHDLVDRKLAPKYKVSEDELKEVLFEVNFTKEQVAHIFHIINTISFSSKQVPDTLEGKIVQDADRLDALGAVGIARTFAYGGARGRLMYGDDDNNDTVSHFHDKLFKLPDLMNTDLAREIAVQRAEFMEEYLHQLNSEIRGEE